MGDRREYRDYRDSRDARDYRDSRDARDYRGGRDAPYRRDERREREPMPPHDSRRAGATVSASASARAPVRLSEDDILRSVVKPAISITNANIAIADVAPPVSGASLANGGAATAAAAVASVSSSSAAAGEAAGADGEQADARKVPEPVSLEQLVKQRQAEREAADRPVFTWKRRQVARPDAANGDAPSSGAAAATASGTSGAPVVVPSSSAAPAVPTRPATAAPSSRAPVPAAAAVAAAAAAPAAAPRAAAAVAARPPREEGEEWEELRKRLLGKKDDYRKVVKPSEKMKRVLDWDLSDDTSRARESGIQVANVPVLFGRAKRGGLDEADGRNDTVYARIVSARTGVDVRSQPAPSSIKEPVQTGERVKHWTEKRLDEMTERDWRILREDFNIVSRGGGNMAMPMRNWDESGLPQELLAAIQENGYTQPTPIQRATIPVEMQNRDVIGIAETGSGKTAAYLFPMLMYILKRPRITEITASEGPYALVLAPTRELAQQIEEEAYKFATPLGIRVMSIVGGVSIEEQAFTMRQGVEILIATPGRLKDCIDGLYLVLNQCTYVVLDEADVMIDMGFEKSLNEILEAMPASNLRPEDETQEDTQAVYRQTTMFSATMPTELEKLARKYLRRPAVISIGDMQEKKYVERITQRVEFMSEAGKRGRLMQLLASGPKPVIVFVKTKKGAETLGKGLAKSGYRATSLHGNKTQEARELSIEGFREGRFDVLVATDVAARGLDIKGVQHVINFDMPPKIEDYQHRIGRTGRAGASGLATSFLTGADHEIFADLKSYLMHSKQHVPRELASHEAANRARPMTL